MYLRYAIAVLARRWLLIVLVAALGLAAGFGWYRSRQIYTTSTHLLYEVSATLAPLRAPAPERFVKTTSQQLLGDQVMEAVAAAQKDGSSADDIRRAMTVSGGTDEDVIEVAISGKLPEQSRNRVEALVHEATSRPPEGVQIIRLWTGPTTGMLSPNLVALGGVGGAVASALLVLLWAAVRRPLLTPSTVDVPEVEAYPDILRGGRAAAAHAPDVLAWIDLRGRGQDQQVIVVKLDDSSDAEEFVRALRSVSAGMTVTEFHELRDALDAIPHLRSVLYVARSGVSTEHEIQHRASTLGCAVDSSAVVLIKARK